VEIKVNKEGSTIKVNCINKQTLTNLTEKLVNAIPEKVIARKVKGNQKKQGKAANLNKNTPKISPQPIKRFGLNVVFSVELYAANKISAISNKVMEFVPR